MKFIDNILNRITMYRLVLYYLLALLVGSVAFSFFGLLGYGPFYIIYSAIFVLLVCLLTNELLAKFFKVPANVESVYITALILVFLITPPTSFGDMTFLSTAFWASVIGMASKYILAINKKHIFNPAAIGVAATYFVLGQSAVWWVGTSSMVALVAVGGFLVVRKIKRWDLVLSFLVVALIGIVVSHLGGSLSPWSVLRRTLLDTAVLFFAFVMLTEPLTTPPTKYLRITYGALTGLLFSGLVNFGPVYFSPELALLAGNIFSYAVSPKWRLSLALSEKIKVAKDTYDFVFKTAEKFKFRPGQYMEWTISPAGADTRGNRRYFTVASSPTESEVRIGVKFYDAGSTFKKNLWALALGDKIFASQLSGDFTLPLETDKKLVFLAGGIGVTPFRSMAKYLVDAREKRDIVILYSTKSIEDIAYGEIFEEAENFGMKTLYAVGDGSPVSSPKIRVGLITGEMIKTEIPDYEERIFYISGPHGMVTAFEETLKQLGVHRSNIKVDYFPGFV